MTSALSLRRTLAVLAALLLSLMLGLALTTAPAAIAQEDDGEDTEEVEEGDDGDEDDADDGDDAEGDDAATGTTDEGDAEGQQVTEEANRVDTGAGGTATSGPMVALALGGLAIAAFGALAYRRQTTSA